MPKQTSKIISQKLRQRVEKREKHFHNITLSDEWICKYKLIYVTLQTIFNISLEANLAIREQQG